MAICCDNSTVSKTDQIREGVLAAEQVGIDAVEAVHKAAASATFIRPETALPAAHR